MTLIEQFLRLYEKKDHLIKKLPSLTDEDKQSLIKLFQEKPHLENKIDWNNKNLTIEDFDEVLNYVSKTEASKSQSKKIPSNFVEGKDYFDITGNDDFKAIVPLNYEFQKFIQNSGYDGLTSEWCIGSNGDNKHWSHYTKNSFFIIIISNNAKVAVQVKEKKNILFWNAADNQSKTGQNWEGAKKEEVLLSQSFLKNKKIYTKIAVEKLESFITQFKDFYRFTDISKNETRISFFRFPNNFGLEIRPIEILEATTLEIPEYSPNRKKITEIGESAFMELPSSFSEVIIPDSIKIIKSKAFQGCSSLTNVKLGNNVREIEEFAFLSCKSLESISLPNSLISIGESVFEGCKSLSSISLPNKLESIGDSAFFNCNSITNLSIPNSIKYVGKHAFQHCEFLTLIDLPSSLTSISKGMFEGCYRLQSITLSDKVGSIDVLAFSMCHSLETVYTNYTKDNYPENWKKETNSWLFEAEWKPIQKILVERYLSEKLRRD